MRPTGEWERNLVATVKLVARIQVITHLAEVAAGPQRPPTAAAPPRAGFRHPVPPRRGDRRLHRRPRRAPAKSCARLPARLSPADPDRDAHRGALRRRLRRLARRAVDHPRAPRAAMASRCHRVGGRVHRRPAGPPPVVRGGRLRLIDEPERHSCRPSVDVLFESIAGELARAPSPACSPGWARTARPACWPCAGPVA